MAPSTTSGFVAPQPMRGETPDAYNARVEQAKKDYEAARQVQTKEKEASAEV